MTHAFIRTLGFGLVLAISNAYASPPSVNPEPSDLDAEILAKIGKEKSKKGGIMEGMKDGRLPSDGSSNNNDCGSVNINSNNDKKSNSGIKEMFGKQSTTIVTGPVINMANCK